MLWLCKPKTLKTLNLKSLKPGFNERGLPHQTAINFTRKDHSATTWFAQTNILHNIRVFYLRGFVISDMLWESLCNGLLQPKPKLEGSGYRYACGSWNLKNY